MSEILIYAPQRVVGMSFTLVQELCAVAAVYAGDDKGMPKLVSLDGKPVTGIAGNQISVDYSLKSAPKARAAFICAFWGGPEETLMREADVIPWLKNLSDEGV